jgi:hypothetical protein
MRDAKTSIGRRYNGEDEVVQTDSLHVLGPSLRAARAFNIVIFPNEMSPRERISACFGKEKSI